jgi:hypothetical protein
MGNFDGFLMIADYNEYTGRMWTFCAPRFSRNANKTNGLWATGDGPSNHKRPYPRSVDMV